MTDIIVPEGVSGQKAKYDPSGLTVTDLANELALLQLGDFIPLDFKLNIRDAVNELAPFRNDWVDYLPRADRHNNRKGLCLTAMEGESHNSFPSMAQAMVKYGRKVSEVEFNHKTAVYDSMKSVHPFFDRFESLGRTFIVKCGIGGYFMPHRDHPSLPRSCFRVVIFLTGCGPYEYDWMIDNDKMHIEPGRAYYVNTRRMHRTMSWVENSAHLVANIPVTTANVGAVISSLQHTH